MATKSKVALKNFTQLGTEVEDYRIIMSVCGYDATGKTHLALSAPGPIAYQNLDRGLEGVGERVVKETGKEVWESQYHFPELVVKAAKKGKDDVTSIKRAAKEVWDEFTKDYRDALENGSGVRTIVWDTGTELWDLCRLAQFGKLTQVMPPEYISVNATFSALINEAYDYDKNLIMLHKMKPIYEKKERTDRSEMSGYSGVPFIAQIALTAEKNTKAEKLRDKFTLEVTKCRQDTRLEGQRLKNHSFADIAMLVYPDSDESEWE